MRYPLIYISNDKLHGDDVNDYEALKADLKNMFIFLKSEMSLPAVVSERTNQFLLSESKRRENRSECRNCRSLISLRKYLNIGVVLLGPVFLLLVFTLAVLLDRQIIVVLVFILLGREVFVVLVFLV
ncbi:hypothetical protein T09_15173 [Trichinella sp. T9]|nr:hypothetical protein T09_15173 [Trichinella sp. T9]